MHWDNTIPGATCRTATARRHIPLWNPYQFAGTPFVANGQSAVFYPLNLPFWLFDVARAFGISAFLHTLLSGIATYFLAQRWGRSRAASLWRNRLELLRLSLRVGHAADAFEHRGLASRPTASLRTLCSLRRPHAADTPSRLNRPKSASRFSSLRCVAHCWRAMHRFSFIA
jgi:hypothetical protein